jgi:hypothetical protein
MKIFQTLILFLLFMISNTVLAQYNPPFTNGPWPGRELPSDQNPVPGMGGFVHDSLFSKACENYMGFSVVLPYNYYNTDYAVYRWPVIYYLHGYTGSETSDVWKSKYYFQRALENQFPEVIMVFPNGMNEWYTNNYHGTLNMESHIINELITYIDSAFRTKTDCKGVVGFSMGGYGAIKFHIKYPHIFNYAVSIDGSLYHPDSKMIDLFKPVFINEENYAFNSVFSWLDQAIANTPAIVRELSIMILEGLYFERKHPLFTDYLNDKGIEHHYFSADLPHDATRFYENYLEVILSFEKENLCTGDFKY